MCVYLLGRREKNTYVFIDKGAGKIKEMYILAVHQSQSLKHTISCQLSYCASVFVGIGSYILCIL